jgi:fibronectin-binding autotransporter adhesin
VVVPGNISGSGGITNIGTGIVVLGGTNTFANASLPTNVNLSIPAGTIRLGSTMALPASVNISMDDNNSPGLVGTLDLNGNNATVASLQGANTGEGNATLVVAQIVNNATGTATLSIGGGGTTTFNGQISDNNNGGTGKLALLVTNNTTLTLNSAYNNLAVNNYPSLFSGGITLSNSSLWAGVNNGTGTPGTEQLSAVGIGPITLEGGLGTVTNGNTRFPSNSILYTLGANGSSSTGGGGTLSGPVIVPAGQFGTMFLPQRGTFSCTLQGGGTLIVEPNYVRGEVGGDWSGFTGTIVFESVALTGSGGSGFSIVSPLGYPNATLFMQITNTAGSVSISGANGGNVFPIGALTGGDNTSLIGGGTQGNGSSGGAANTIWAIGGLNLTTTNGSQIVDVGCGIRKVGTGVLALTNSVLSFGGQCVVSNGTLVFIPLGNYTNGVTSLFTALTNNYLVCSNFTVVSPGILDVSQMGGTLYLGHSANNQTLFGNGTINGNLQTMAGTNTLIAPAWRVNSGGTVPGTLTVNGTAAVNFASTIQMAVNRTSTPVSDSFIANASTTPTPPTINSTAFHVINAGDTAFAPLTTNVFQFFNAAVTVNLGGSSGITNITVFTNLPAGMFWVTNLNGTLAGYPTVPAGAMAIVNTNASVALNAYPPSIQTTVNGSTLTLGWPTNLGWVLQAQTNGLSVGLTPTNNWVDVPGSVTATQQVITINQTNPAVFYRMRNPSAPVQ